jgi:hypothetical protein
LVKLFLARSDPRNHLGAPQENGTNQPDWLVVAARRKGQPIGLSQFTLYGDARAQRRRRLITSLSRLLSPALAAKTANQNDRVHQMK